MKLYNGSKARTTGDWSDMGTRTEGLEMWSCVAEQPVVGASESSVAGRESVEQHTGCQVECKAQSA
jgi:hypothetical protein